MPSKPSSDVFGSCASRAKYVTQYARRIESRCKSVADRNQVFSGAYVSYLAFFESQIEELFVGLICGKYTHPDSMVKPLVLMPDKTTAKLIVTGGRSYVDWLPYDAHTRKRASSFLADGAPFKGLSNPSRKVLGKSFIIRNALAHSSEHSQRRFKEELIKRAIHI